MEKLETLLENFEGANSESFKQATDNIHEYFTAHSATEDDLHYMRNKFVRYNKARAIKGKGRYMASLGTMILKYGNGGKYAKQTAVDLFYMVTNRSMAVKRYIGLESLASAPVYNGAKDENRYLTTSLVEYLCNAVQSGKENEHFKARSVAALASLYPRLNAARRNGKKAKYRADINESLQKIKLTMEYVKKNKKHFGKSSEYACDVLN